MIPAIITLLVLACGWQAYRTAKQKGIWSNKQFFMILGCAAVLCAVITAPFYLVSPQTIDAHQGLFLGVMIGAIFVGVIFITILANRWRKRG
jgi:uncharacterized BrkB/YihY/UPF0761 family membrane protein